MATKTVDGEWLSTSAYTPISVIGSFDGLAHKAMDHATQARLMRAIARQITEWNLNPQDVELVTNGSAWVGFAAIQLFLDPNSKVEHLTICLPTRFLPDIQRFDPNTPIGAEMNANYTAFSAAMRAEVHQVAQDKHDLTPKEEEAVATENATNTDYLLFDAFALFKAAIKKGATCETYATRDDSNHATATSLGVIACTFGENVCPKQRPIWRPNTVHKIWTLATRKVRHHFPFDYFFSCDEQALRVPLSHRTFGGDNQGATKRRKLNISNVREAQTTLTFSARGTVRVEAGDIANLTDAQKTTVSLTAHLWSDKHAFASPMSTGQLQGTIEVEPASGSADLTQQSPGKRKRAIPTPPMAQMFAQLRAGATDQIKGDTSQNRLTWFKECLGELTAAARKENPAPTVALPFQVGCDGTAEGKWAMYRKAIVNWARETGIDVILIKPAEE